MKFWVPVKTPKQFISAVEKIFKKQDLPARVTIEEMSLPGHALIVITKFGTTTIELALSPDGDGMIGEIVKQQVASFHRAFIDKVDSWIKDEMIAQLGGRIVSDD